MSKKKVVYLKIEDWEELMSYLTQIARNSDDRYAVYDAVEDRLVKAQLPGVIEFEATAEKPVPATSPHRLEVCHENAFTGLELSLDDFEWGEPVKVLVVKEKP